MILSELDKPFIPKKDLIKHSFERKFNSTFLNISNADHE